MSITIPDSRLPLVGIFLEKNSQINLSAIRDPEGVYVKHILDGLEPTHHSFVDELFQNADTMLDVGTGGGFPLLPLAKHYEHLDCHGLDARQKKTKAVESIAEHYGLENVTLHRGRAEDKKKKLGKFDIVTARGVTYADQLFNLCFRLTKRKGWMVWWKQFTFEEDAMIVELSNDQRIISYKTFDYTLPGLEDQKRRIYCMQKR